MYISIKKSKLILRRQAGFSVEAATKTVAGLPLKTFGKREKVRSADIDAIVKEANKPSPIAATSQRTIRPFQKRLKQQIQQWAETQQ